MGKRQEAALLTRQKIIDAVKELAHTKAYEEMSIEDITQAAGVAKGTFYVHFKRREDVCAEISYENFQGLARDLSKMELSGADKVAWYLRKSIEVIEDNGLEISQQWMKAVVAPAKDEVLGLRKLSLDVDLIESCLKDGITHGELPAETDAKTTAQMIESAFFGAISVWCMSNGEIPFRPVAEMLCNEALPAIIKRS